MKSMSSMLLACCSLGVACVADEAPGAAPGPEATAVEAGDLSTLNNWMRACVRFNGASFCTPGHDDT